MNCSPGCGEMNSSRVAETAGRRRSCVNIKNAIIINDILNDPLENYFIIHRYLNNLKLKKEFIRECVLHLRLRPMCSWQPLPLR
jgi:hypothetical protein